MRPTSAALLRFVATVFLFATAFAANTQAAPAALPAPVLLVSMDGFRWDYVKRHPEAAPTLRRLAQEGVSAEALIPVYPTNTFPNHYSVVTGLYPSHHGIVNNTFYDAARGQIFRSNTLQASRDGAWWSGEPIWITAVLQGRRAVCSFWPGSEARIKGVNATEWKPFDYSVPFETRLDELVSWLARPGVEKPAIATFYLEETNGVGHPSGPDSPELVAAVRLLDGRLGRLLARLEEIHQPVNVVIVADHGMTPCGPDRVLFLDDYLDLASVQIDFDETSVGLRPAAGATADQILTALQKLPPAAARPFAASALPAHFHVDPASPRVPPIWIVPAEGWHVMTHAAFERQKANFNKGQHGYDPALPNMHAILIAHGPAFKTDGSVVPAVENVHVYNLLCAAAGLTPALNDGDDRLVKSMLR